MRKYNFPAFHDLWEGPNERYSTAEFNDRLGTADQLVFQWRATKVGGTVPTLTITLYGSNNGADWILRETLVNGTALNLGVLNTGAAQSSTRLMAFNRIGVSMAGPGGPSGDIEVLVCGRDTAG
ncbi:MAG: hypothetical protein HY909_09300 [Deltaproteobacteria bacterium]|nr:hypothetical protein [Deltaproteobacteria bacterium]